MTDQPFDQDDNGPTPPAVEHSRPQPVQLPGSSGSVISQPLDQPLYRHQFSPPGANKQPVKTYTFVTPPGNATHKRSTSRPRYDEIERPYRCNWDGCTKSYSTLNHLNTHITMQEHGAKRTPKEFNEVRKLWRTESKEAEQKREHHAEADEEYRDSLFTSLAAHTRMKLRALTPKFSNSVTSDDSSEDNRALIPLLGPYMNRSVFMDNMDEYLDIDRTEPAVSGNGDVIQGDDAGVGPSSPEVDLPVAPCSSPTDGQNGLFPSPENSDVFVDDLATQITALSTRPSNVRGGFCDLYIEHSREGKVALKRPRISEEDYESKAIERFIREANIWRALQHPNVLRFLGACKIDGALYLVSPFMCNGTVMEFIRRHSYKADRIGFIREIASALDYLHAQCIIHGDLKGVNILVSDNGHALLCDFGLSRMDHVVTSTTMKGVGSVRWQAPEIWNGAPKSFKTDVYAFGMTAVEILSGDIPFKKYVENVAVITAVLIYGERPDKAPIASPEGVSYEGIWRIASDCWQKDPEKRPSMSGVLQALLVEQLVSESPLSTGS
ncbi:hypothetical protein FRB99_001368 [Tulasnella sp. 403]|nr:hypothetical protein FRB99_001368 [Tulasnella sp. 403]